VPVKMRLYNTHFDSLSAYRADSRWGGARRVCWSAYVTGTEAGSELISTINCDTKSRRSASTPSATCCSYLVTSRHYCHHIRLAVCTLSILNFTRPSSLYSSNVSLPTGQCCKVCLDTGRLSILCKCRISFSLQPSPKFNYYNSKYLLVIASSCWVCMQLLVQRMPFLLRQFLLLGLSTPPTFLCYRIDTSRIRSIQWWDVKGTVVA
jgi:hypothetical protein